MVSVRTVVVVTGVVMGTLVISMLYSSSKSNQNNATTSSLSPATTLLDSSEQPNQISSPMWKDDEQEKKKEAYATIYYCGTPKDYEYFIGIRVMWQSLRETGTTRDMVTLVTPDVPQSYRNILRADGVIVQEVNFISNPYSSQYKYSDRFKYAMVKLMAWNMTSYDRVILLDADVIFLNNIDHAFKCGNFCAVYINPCIFHTGLVILQPDSNTFSDMILKLAQHIDSYDGADQGFLNSYFHHMLEAPLFTPEVVVSSDNPVTPYLDRLEGLWRLPFGYHLDHFYYYQRFSWEVPCSACYVVGFPSLPGLKPWNWYSSPLLDLTNQWTDVRTRLPKRTTDQEQDAQVMWVGLLPVLLTVGGLVLLMKGGLVHLRKMQDRGMDPIWDQLERVINVMMDNYGTCKNRYFLLMVPCVGLMVMMMAMMVTLEWIIPKTMRPVWMGWVLFQEYILFLSFPIVASNVWWCYKKGRSKCVGEKTRGNLAYSKSVSLWTPLMSTALWISTIFLVMTVLLVQLGQPSFPTIIHKIVYSFASIVGWNLYAGYVLYRVGYLWYSVSSLSAPTSSYNYMQERQPVAFP